MLQLAGVGALVLLLLGRRKGAPAHGSTEAFSDAPSGGKNPTAGQPGGAQAYGALKQEYQAAAQKLGFGPDAPTDLPAPLMAQVVSAVKPGHSGDQAALAGQIANYYSKQANLPPGSVKFLEAIVGVVPGVGPVLKGIISKADTLSKVGGGSLGSLGRTPHAVAGSAAAQQAAELGTGPEGYSGDWVGMQIQQLARDYNAAGNAKRKAMLRVIRAALEADSFHSAVNVRWAVSYYGTGITDRQAKDWAEMNARKETRSAPGWIRDVRIAFAGLL